MVVTHITPNTPGLPGRPDLITITQAQYDADLEQSYEAGRADERRRAREAAQQAMVGRRHDSISAYLKARGWRIDQFKANGVEWVDRNGNFRIGVPNKITAKSWMHVLEAIAKYYGGSSQTYATEILSHRGSN